MRNEDLHEDEDVNCGFLIHPDVEMTDEMRCRVEALGRRCDGEIDRCFYRCGALGRGDNIGGGCAHICNRGLRKQWTHPQADTSCMRKAKAAGQQ